MLINVCNYIFLWLFVWSVAEVQILWEWQPSSAESDQIRAKTRTNGSQGEPRTDVTLSLLYLTVRVVYPPESSVCL